MILLDYDPVQVLIVLLVAVGVILVVVASAYSAAFHFDVWVVVLGVLGVVSLLGLGLEALGRI